MPYMILDAKGRGTLPEEVRAELSLEGGDVVLLEPTGYGTYEIVPASIIPKNQLWFHHPDVRTRVSEAEADFASGRVTSASSPEEAQRALDTFKLSQPPAGVGRKKAR
jgi:bifunctional DNA-binding transcriptional regulator/antitoxin component of YhaV-PrlF toxin-antitoxin module